MLEDIHSGVTYGPQIGDTKYVQQYCSAETDWEYPGFSYEVPTEPSTKCQHTFDVTVTYQYNTADAQQLAAFIVIGPPGDVVIKPGEAATPQPTPQPK